MDLDLLSTPLITVGRELGTFVASNGILSKAWNEILSTPINDTDSFLWNEHENVVYVTFPSFHVKDFIVRDGRYEACNINNESGVFSECLKGNDDQPVLVHEGALTRFLHILGNSNFKALMERFTTRKGEQVIIFVGHSMGGAVATLATIWLLEQRSTQISPFCITFGSPLVGDVRLGEAVGREDWSGKFCHVVSKHDIVPRMLFAPFESIAQPLNAVLPHWRSTMGNASSIVAYASIQEPSKTLFNIVLQCTSTIAESSLISPYRPFGTYMFCSSHGTACIEDPEAILEMLRLTMLCRDGESFEEVAEASISEHPAYGKLLEKVIACLLNTRTFENPISDSFETRISLELEAMGIGAQNDCARAALRRAAEKKSRHEMNIADLKEKLSKNQSCMAMLEWYKSRCAAEGPGYYDSFKQQDRRDMEADKFRRNLAAFWDEVVDMVEKHDLPSDFQFQNKWINAGNTYRKLVEPLDIAYFYHAKKDNRSYVSEGVRPRRHIVLEKWLREKNKTRRRRGRDNKKSRTKFASLTDDSCFWAYVEEACKSLTSLQEARDQVMHAQFKENLEAFEGYVWKMIEDCRISAEVFLPNSGFMNWWQGYRDVQLSSTQWTSGSSLFKFMESQGWKLENWKTQLFPQ